MLQSVTLQPQSMTLCGGVQPDEDGPMFFHHVSQMPFGCGNRPSRKMLMYLEASDRLHWLPELKRLMRRCKEEGCCIEESQYIVLFEQYVFEQPHSRLAWVRPPACASLCLCSHCTASLLHTSFIVLDVFVAY